MSSGLFRAFDPPLQHGLASHSARLKVCHVRNSASVRYYCMQRIMGLYAAVRFTRRALRSRTYEALLEVGASQAVRSLGRRVLDRKGKSMQS